MTRAVVMAGGLGTRLADVSSGLPKPMVSVCGRPVLEWQLECLVRQGIKGVTLVVGHLAEAIESHFGDGSAFGASITYFYEKEPLGTAGALAIMRDEFMDDFVLLNGDLMLDVNFGKMLEFHRASGSDATVAAHPSLHPQDSTLVEADGDGRVAALHFCRESRGPVRNLTNAGVHVLSPRALKGLPAGGRLDLDCDVLAPLVSTGRLFSYRTTEYIRDIGTPERYERVQADVEAGIPEKRSLSRPQRTVFLDRDGTINEHVGFVTNPSQLRLVPGVADAIRRINSSGLLAVCVTNQPVVARGDVTSAKLEAIHARLEELLAEEGSYLDDIIYCPHHPDRGFPGEVPELKVECGCRKPKPGLLFEAARRHHINLASSWMVGDSESDVQAGQAAGCHTAMIGRDGSLSEIVEQILVG